MTQILRGRLLILGRKHLIECSGKGEVRPHKQYAVSMLAPEDVSVGFFEGGAAHDQALSVCQMTIDDASQLVQPRPSVIIIQRNPSPHLVCAAATRLPEMHRRARTEEDACARVASRAEHLPSGMARQNASLGAARSISAA